MLIQTDFPEPVVPAIKRCGIETKSPTIGKPEILLPSVIGILISLLLNSLLEIISFKATFSLTLFGISIPMVLLPGTVATLVDIELVFRAISSDKLIIFEVLIPAQDALKFWDEVFIKGKKYGAKPVGLGARDTLRTEMAYPLHGQDISLSISPLEAGLSWAVNLAKPKFLGKDALVKEQSNGVTRKLVGIKAVDRAIPRSHMKVMDENSIELGEITSGTFSPTLKAGIALALVDSKIKIGDKVFVDVRGKAAEFLVVKPPFVESKVR